ncbi:MAG TPA: hypothetical protein VHD86_23335, partial [Xanthobacteraceae bacterium]|nr:hypothetical protein [Xanthobacteraceae bacterium]
MFGRHARHRRAAVILGGSALIAFIATAHSVSADDGYGSPTAATAPQVALAGQPPAAGAPPVSVTDEA